MLASASPFVRQPKSMEQCIQEMLPKGESILHMEIIEGGFSNNLWRVDTETQSYILRSPKSKNQPSDFLQMLSVSKHASKCGISPQLVGEHTANQLMLLEYIEQMPWPTYEENSGPYNATMKVLKSFHDNMQPLLVKERENSYEPFAFIFKEGKSLEMSLDIPIHFSVALKKVEAIYERLKPWLKNHATLCHGDFHEGNVLLSKEKKCTPFLIDFDSLAIGDPFFDVVKFSVALPWQYRMELLSEYVGGRPLTTQEKAHFELMDHALLMVIAIVRFQSAAKLLEFSQDRLTKEEMEEMLDSKDPLPSFLTIPFKDSSPKAKQMGAIYALGEFLRRSEALSVSAREDMVVKK